MAMIIEKFNRKGTTQVVTGEPELSGPLSGMVIILTIKDNKEPNAGYKIVMPLAEVQRVLTFSDVRRDEFEKIKEQFDPKRYST